jgi:hypothetical protein
MNGASPPGQALSEKGLRVVSESWFFERSLGGCLNLDIRRVACSSDSTSPRLGEEQGTWLITDAPLLQSLHPRSLPYVAPGLLPLWLELTENEDGSARDAPFTSCDPCLVTSTFRSIRPYLN